MFSKYQEAVFEFITNGSGSVIVDAKAGSGKTTTIVEAANRIPTTRPDGSPVRVLFLAFNKAIVTELQARLPKHVECSTFNALGHRAWIRATGARYLKVETSKTRDILRARLSDDDLALYSAYVCKVVALCKSYGILPNATVEDVAAVAANHGIYLESEDANEQRAHTIVLRALEAGIEMSNKIIDFDDQLYMPFVRSIRFERYDYVFIDEAQDTNTVQKFLLKNLLAPVVGHLIAVGDPYQAIYGFRGAGSDSMEQIRSMFDCTVLPLSISYRCARNIIVEAQKYVPSIEAASTAPDGVVSTLDTYNTQTFMADRDCAVICRKNAPLVSFAFQSIARGMGIEFLGRDLLGGLRTLFEKYKKAPSINAIAAKIDEWSARERAKMEKKEQDEYLEVHMDKMKCIEIILERAREFGDNYSAIDKALAVLENSKGLVLTSAHRSKGREWLHAFILDPELMPSPMAKLPWQKRQEINLLYVAITRGKHTLTYIKSNSWS